VSVEDRGGWCGYHEIDRKTLFFIEVWSVVNGMEGSTVVDFLLGLDDLSDSTVRVVDSDGTEWQGHLDHTEYTDPTPDLSRDEGYISYSFIMSDDESVKTPGMGFGASITIEEVDDDWGSPEIVYNDPQSEGLEDFIVKELASVEVIDDE